jgi:hypothetical protein
MLQKSHRFGFHCRCSESVRRYREKKKKRSFLERVGGRAERINVGMSGDRNRAMEERLILGWVIPVDSMRTSKVEYDRLRNVLRCN